MLECSLSITVLVQYSSVSRPVSGPRVSQTHGRCDQKRRGRGGGEGVHDRQSFHEYLCCASSLSWLSRTIISHLGHRFGPGTVDPASRSWQNYGMSFRSLLRMSKAWRAYLGSPALFWRLKLLKFQPLEPKRSTFRVDHRSAIDTS